LEGIEKMRKKSTNLHGGYSGKIKTRVEFAKAVVDTLAERAEDQGSAIFNRARKEELERQIRILERKVTNLKKELDESEARNKNLRVRVHEFEERIGSLS